jgi:hypothetical protein
MSSHPEFVQAARDWVLDCSWKENPEDILEMSDTEILRGVERHYDGGLSQFARDGLDATWEAEAADVVEGWAR